MWVVRKNGWVVLPLCAVAVVLSACIEIVGIEEPTLVADVTDFSGIDRTWPLWPMPNPANVVGLPNPSNYTVDEENDVVFDNVTGLLWQRTVPSVQGTLPSTYCKTLVLAGHDDWRLPSRIELVSIVDFTRVDPAIDVNAFPNTPIGLFATNGALFTMNSRDGSTFRSGAWDHLRCVR
jgi:hypothetical protein